ncbi:hypothetical protein LTR70_007629 [Exophiala xenobiotica]|uniref:C2H2-type domain-containing protein n=1 Tax=Lithohypha guttulata TaxID=1690604 RepID=A0ABR0K3R3_9EURO|nr:hypothetical protein LTR24_007161 [Lithohypha guttulata]KAK5313443.1 hypothetical protein LTR70_007629 [Exophiala xenobiotica]
MPHLYSDSGYGSTKHINMARQRSNESQTLYTPNNDPYILQMPGQFPRDYRDARSSVSGFDSMAEQSFHSPLDLSMNDNIDPTLDGSAALAGLTAAGNHLAFDQFTIQDQDPTDNITQTSPFSRMPRSDQTLILPTGHDTSNNPWNSFQLDPPMQQQQMNFLQSPTNRRKRVRPSEPDTGYASQGQTTPSFSSSPGQQVQQFDASFEQQTYPYPGVPGYNNVADPSVPYQPRRELHQHYEDDQPGPSSTAHTNRATQSRAQSRAQRPPRNQARKHECEYCSPKQKVFKTVNDLDRHRKTVHSTIKPGERVWKCGVPGCLVATKIWARLDNFKQHVVRMHDKKYAAEAENMCISYDPTVHTTSESGRNTKSSTRPPRLSQDTSSNFSPDEVMYNPDDALHPRAAISPPESNCTRTQASRHLITPLSLVTQTPTSVDSSMIMNGFRSASMSSNGGNAQAFLAPSQYLSHSTGFGMPGHRSTARTVAAPETIRQQLEMLQQDNATPQPAFVKASSADFASMGGALGESAQSTTLNSANLAASGHGAVDVALDLGFQDAQGQGIDLKNVAKTFGDSLPAGYRERFQSIIQMLQVMSPEPTDRSKSVSSKPSSKGKRVNREQTEKNSNIRCEERVVEKGVERCCNKTFERNSELNKHKNRHLRRRFGTKWEWKRHEHNQHVQLDVWRCHRSSCVKACQQLFASKQAFVEHLETQRNATDTDLEVEAKASHVSKRWLGSWWCGFCERVIESTASFGADMDKERNDHVSDHIDGKSPPKIDMLDWFELAGEGKTKRQVKKNDQEGSLRNATKDLNDDKDRAESLQQIPGDGYDSSSEDEQESQTELDETISRPRPVPPNDNMTRAERVSMSIEIPQQRRSSSATAPQLHLVSPSGEVSAPSVDERGHDFPHHAWPAVHQKNYVQQPTQHRHQYQQTQETQQQMPQNFTNDYYRGSMELDDGIGFADFN